MPADNSYRCERWVDASILGKVRYELRIGLIAAAMRSQ
jgi:hypothetical protein